MTRGVAFGQPTFHIRGDDMFYKSFITSAVVVLMIAFVAGAAILPGYGTGEGRTVEFTTVTPTATVHTVPVGALGAARAYAAENGLTDCVDPARARLDDVILTVPGDPLAGMVVTPVGFDEALQSGELDRWNVLACKGVERAT